jgi:hypothetical protein
MKPSVQFAKRKDGVTIAYSAFGTGPPLIMPPPWVTNLSFVLENPFMNQFLEQLTQNMMVIFYDKHGFGQSDRNRTELQILISDISKQLAVGGKFKLKGFGDSIKLHKVFWKE